MSFRARSGESKVDLEVVNGECLTKMPAYVLSQQHL